MSAADHKTLLKVRGEIIAELSGDDAPAAAKEYFQLCPDHVDYMWDIQHEKP